MSNTKPGERAGAAANVGCELLVDGKLYGGWKRIEVQRSIEQIAGGFVLELTSRWPGVDVPQGLREGLPCQVRLDGDTVITGYIDLYEVEVSDITSTVRVEGRDKTGDLVDCSAIHKTGQWHNVSLEQIVRDICAPFQITVLLDAGIDTGEAFKSFALEECEKAFDSIDRACRLRAVLATSTATGALLLTQASDAATGLALIEGDNVLRMSATHSWKERHSLITIKTQVPGDDNEYGEAAAHIEASNADAEIDRYRPLTVIAEHGTSAKSVADRAKWENLVRMGRGKRGRCSVVGWRTGRDGVDGPLWDTNTLAQVTSARLNLDQEMLIVGCAYALSEQGCTTELTFARREAFELVEGIGRSRLGKRINDKTQHEKKKKGDGFVPSWSLAAPTAVKQ